MFGQAVLIGLLVLWTYFLWARRKYYAFALKMPGDWGLPLLGTVLKIYKREVFLYKLPQLASEYKTKSYVFWLGPVPMLYTIDPKIAEKILNTPSCINKSSMYGVVNEALGEGLLTSKSPEWNRRRKLINPCFSHNVLISFIPIFNKLSRQLCETLETHVNCGEINVKEFVFETTMRSSIATTMGLDDTDEAVKLFKEHFETAVAIVTRQVLEPWLRISILFQRTSMSRILTNSLDILKGFVYKLVLDKIQILERLEKDESGNQQESDAIRKVGDIFLDKAIKVFQQKKFTLNDVATEANLMVAAAFETTATTMYSVLMFLAMHPQYQEKLFEEIVSVFPDEDFEVDQEDFKSLVYLNMCINETMRVAASIPIIARKTDADVAISDDLVIPQGVDVLVDIFNMHRDEDVWGPTAKNFDPDHFLPENLANKPKHAFMPFSAGPRNCIGWQYAGIFMKIALSKVLRKYRFSTKFRFEDLHYRMHIVLKLQTFPHLEVHRR